MIDFVEPGEVEDFRPLDLALSHDGKTMYVADWSMGGWGRQDREAGARLRDDLRGSGRSRPDPEATIPTRSPSRSRSSTTLRCDERIARTAALTKRGAAALAETTAALADAETPPLAKRHLVWAVDAVAGATPEGDHAC